MVPQLNNKKPSDEDAGQKLETLNMKTLMIVKILSMQRVWVFVVL